MNSKTSSVALEYELSFRQQVQGARSNPGSKRPMDASPMIRVRTRSRSQPKWAPPASASTYFLFASLVTADSLQELYLGSGGKEKYIKGSAVSSITYLNDPEENGMSAYFIFGDLGVRVDGNYRFKMTLYQLAPERVEFCSEILSDPFEVVHSVAKPPVWHAAAKSITQPIKKPIKRPLSPPTEEQDGSSLVSGSPVRPSVSNSSLLEYGKTQPKPPARTEPFEYQPASWSSNPVGNQGLASQRRNSFEMRPGPPRVHQQYEKPLQKAQSSQYPQQSQHRQAIPPYHAPEYANYPPASRSAAYGHMERQNMNHSNASQYSQAGPYLPPSENWQQNGTLNYRANEPPPKSHSTNPNSNNSSLAMLLGAKSVEDSNKRHEEEKPFY